MSKDRPGGMDDLKIDWVKPTQKTPKMSNEMGAVARVAAGPVNADRNTSAATRKAVIPKL